MRGKAPELADAESGMARKQGGGREKRAHGEKERLERGGKMAPHRATQRQREAPG